MAISVYTPLKKWQIRLLQLLPGDAEDELQGELLVADVVEGMNGAVIHEEQTLVNFRTISYAWGDPKFTDTVSIRQYRMGITPTLGLALRELRWSGDSQYIWADAVCINQDDDDEKSSQVQRMATIFSKSVMTIVYLGPAAEHTALAMEHLKPKSRDVESEDESRSRLLLAGLIDIYTRPWMRRVWVQQEVRVANQIDVKCGHTGLSFANFQRGITKLQTLAKTVEPAYDISGHTTKCCNALKAMRATSAMDNLILEHERLEKKQSYECQCYNQTGLRTNIECVLSQCNDLLATNPRDRIYGLLGLTNCHFNAPAYFRTEERGASLDVNYSKPTSVVFQDLTKYIIDRDHSLTILFEHQPISGAGNDLSLPSWCPDWRVFRHRRDPRVTDNYTKYRTMPEEAAMRWKRQLFKAHGRLFIDGRMMGFLENITAPNRREEAIATSRAITADGVAWESAAHESSTWDAFWNSHPLRGPKDDDRGKFDINVRYTKTIQHGMAKEEELLLFDSCDLRSRCNAGDVLVAPFYDWNPHSILVLRKRGYDGFTYVGQAWHPYLFMHRRIFEDGDWATQSFTIH
jgi:hypothetical protein